VVLIIRGRDKRKLSKRGRVFIDVRSGGLQGEECMESLDRDYRSDDPRFLRNESAFCL